MTTRLCHPGDRFADWSFARGCFAPLAALGVKVGSRYISNSFSPFITSGKCISIAERDEFFARGWGLLLNWEGSATDPLGGAAKGKLDGRRCYQILRLLSYPVDPRIKITVSCDFDARAYVPVVKQYMTAFHGELGEYGAQMNCYGGSYACLANTWCSPHWLTASRAWSDPTIWKAIVARNFSDPSLREFVAYQTSAGATASWDMDVLIKPAYVWTGLGADVPVVNPVPHAVSEDDDVKYITITCSADPARSQFLLAMDGNGMTILGLGSPPTTMATLRPAYGPRDSNGRLAVDANGQPIWAELADVDTDTYDDIVRRAKAFEAARTAIPAGGAANAPSAYKFTGDITPTV